MLNPSTADHQKDDPTIQRIIKFTRSWNYGGLVVVNVFPYRSPSPKECKRWAEWDKSNPPDWHTRSMGVQRLNDARYVISLITALSLIGLLSAVNQVITLGIVVLVGYVTSLMIVKLQAQHYLSNNSAQVRMKPLMTKMQNRHGRLIITWNWKIKKAVIFQNFRVYYKSESFQHDHCRFIWKAKTWNG